MGAEELPVPSPLWSHFLLGVIMYGCLDPSGFLLSLLGFLRPRTRKPWPGNESLREEWEVGGGGEAGDNGGKAAGWNNPSTR